MNIQSVPETGALTDLFGRNFPYLRLSLTDVCNFACSYCLPDGYQCTGKKSFLSSDEIMRLIEAFATLGVFKIRLTGGEPTVRKDFEEIARAISNHPSIRQLAFTTNGYRLREKATLWQQAGLSHINVSVDSLDPHIFHQITGHDRLSDILEGIEAAINAGFKKIKLNAVLMKNVNDLELDAFLAYVKNRTVSVRFIELMQTGDNTAFFKKHHVSANGLQKRLLKYGWNEKSRAIEDGPAVEYTHADYQGTIGLISPYARDFCKGCNRLRITATGDLRLCLFGNQGISLRHLLQDDRDREELQALILGQLAFKRSKHFLEFGDTGITPHLASVGG